MHKFNLKTLKEKAYAKFHGSYTDIVGGLPDSSLVDMTGGINEVFDLKKLNTVERENLWTVLYQSIRKNSFISCS